MPIMLLNHASALCQALMKRADTGGCEGSLQLLQTDHGGIAVMWQQVLQEYRLYLHTRNGQSSSYAAAR